MLVFWKKENIKVIPIHANKALDMGFKKLSGKGQIVLQPGWNDVNDGDWEYAATIESIQRQLEEGDLKVQGGEEKEVEVNYGEAKKKVKKTAPKPFTELTPKAAKGLVKDTNSIETLEGWLDADSRDEVRLAIQKRLDEVKSHGENK